MAKILLVDDEIDILDLIRYNLEVEGHEIETAEDGIIALEKVQVYKPELMILDVMLPGYDGWEVLRALRKNQHTQNIPVIFLTAKDDEVDEIVGLELGAADYIVKPISIRKLIARVKNVLRQQYKQVSEPSAEPIEVGPLSIFPEKFQVRVDGHSIDLTKREFEVLHFLATKPGRVISRDALLDNIWGDDIVIIDRTIDVHIWKIREKLGPEVGKMIETIRGVGYRFTEF